MTQSDHSSDEYGCSHCINMKILQRLKYDKNVKERQCDGSPTQIQPDLGVWHLGECLALDLIKFKSNFINFDNNDLGVGHPVGHLI